MSAFDPIRTELASVYYNITAKKDVLWKDDAQRSGRLGIYDKLEFRRLFDGKITWFGTFENFGRDACGLAIQAGEARPIGH